MSRETDIEAVLEADVTLMAILTGGVYTAGALGLGGINRQDTAVAFSNGYLQPCALVKQRSFVPDGVVVDHTTGHASAARVIEIYVYEDAGYTNIDGALARIFTLLHGHQFTNSFPLQWINTIDRARDNAALDGASMSRQDWLINEVLGD